MEPIRPYTVRVQTTDLEEARAVCGEQLHPRSLRLIETSGGFAARLAVLQLGSLSLGDVRYGAEIAGTTELGSYHVNLPLGGRFTARQGRRRIDGDPGHAGVYRPVGETVLLRSSADCHLLALKIEREALERHLERLLDADVRGPVQLAAGMDPTSSPGRLCAGLIRLLGDEIRNPTGLAHQPMMTAPLQESLMTALLFAVGHQYQDALRARAPRSGGHQITRAIDAVHSFPERPYTVAELAEIAGLSMRSMCEEFQLRVGMAPMAYLREIRLARAHAELTDGDPAQTTVASVAHRWGFPRPGVFAARYLARYHTTPGRTLLGRAATGGDI